MKRSKFLKSLMAVPTLLTMDGFAHLVNAIPDSYQAPGNEKDFATFGAIHLNITDIAKSTQFYTKVVGMKLRKSEAKRAEFGTEDQTLVVVHQTAKNKFQKGYSGLYHFAIHAPNIAEFASMINRLNANRYPYSPIDHTMSKSIYLDDPDGINVEFTLETPERYKRVISTGGLKIEGADGVVRSASERLDVNAVMKELKDTNVDKVIDKATYLGHLHLYANNVQNSNEFYKTLGYLQFNYLPQYMYADVGAGGHYKHRVAMNSWHGRNRPMAPSDSAGMRHFQINFREKDKLNSVIAKLSDYQEKDGGYWFTDPTGNTVFLTSM